MLSIFSLFEICIISSMCSKYTQIQKNGTLVQTEAQMSSYKNAASSPIIFLFHHTIVAGFQGSRMRNVPNYD